MEPTISDSEDDTDSFDDSGYEVDVSPEDYANNATVQQEDASGAAADPSTKKQGPGRKIAAVLKRTVRAGVDGALGLDHVKAKVGSEQAKQRLGAVADPSPAVAAEKGALDSPEKADVARLNLPGGEGPCVFSGRLHGKTGHILLVSSAASPCVAFVFSKLSKSLVRSLLPGKKGDETTAALEVRPEFTIGMQDIAELRKMGGFGWKGKMVVGWALGREVVDGLEIVDREGNRHVLTAIKGRDELFNRLIAMGGQKWESW